jgi:hypothetical protein
MGVLALLVASITALVVIGSNSKKNGPAYTFTGAIAAGLILIVPFWLAYLVGSKWGWM